MNTPRDPALDVLPRSPQRTTALGQDVAILYSASEPRYRALAEQLAAAIAARGGTRPECIADTTLLPERSTPLPAAYRKRPLVVLGNLNTNRVLLPLYADYLCSTDAVYPGADGYDLRTLVNPYGTGSNLILAGGSSLRGVERAVEKLLAAIGTAGPGVTVPFLLQVEVSPALLSQLARWPYTSLDDSTALQASRGRGLMFITEPIRLIGAYTMMWSLTADERYAVVARDNLRWLNERMTDGYGDWHYLAERFLRAMPLLTASGLLTDADVHRTDHLLMLTALGNQNEWWRMRVGHPPLGHRHQGKGTYEFLLLARYLRDYAHPTPALRALCERWYDECCLFLDALARARGDDQDDESCLNNIATIFRYALGQERHAFFTSGDARRVAERCLALHDNNGNGAGQGGYGESQGMYLQQEATVQTASSAFYYGDGRLKWILHQLPNLAIPQRYPFLQYAPVFLQNFATGPELVAEPPPADRTFHCLPLTDHQFTISNHPPVHYEPAGHLVNAPETWELAEAIALNRLPQARGFDKFVLRGGYQRDDAYLMIQGYQGGFRWQGHMQAANCLVRFFQAGHVWLVQNTSRHSFYDKNGLFISDGRNDTPMPPIAELVAGADFPPVTLTISRLSDYHHTEWTRHIFWSKAGAGCFVVIDRTVFQSDGPYSLTCTWRTPGHAELAGRRWTSLQGQHRFTLVAGTNVPATCDIDSDQGACEPYVLRQRRAGSHRAGDEATFQNLFYVRGQEDATSLDLQRIDERSSLVLRNGQPAAWCGIELASTSAWLPGANARAVSAWVEPAAMAFAGATSVVLAATGWQIRSEQPVGVLLDLDAATLTLRLDTPGIKTAAVTLTLSGEARQVTLTDALTVPLATPACATLRAALSSWLGGLRPVLAAPTPASAAESQGGWTTAWTYDSGTRRPERVRKVCVSASPLPVDASPEQLLDPVLPDGYSREIWTQWPEATHYDLTLTFPEPRAVTALNILGDCIDDPSLRVFNPLPDGITVEAETAGGKRHTHPVTAGPDRHYKRYRDAENRLEVRTAAINEVARSLHVRVPAPSGRPLVLHRLEVLGDRAVAPALQHWIAADLNSDGRSEIVTVNAVNELFVINDEGRELWRQALPVPVTHISAQPIDASGPPVLCVGLLGGELRLYQPDGSLRLARKLAEEFRERTDCLMGWFNAIHALAIWHRGADGRGSLMMGGYGIVVFLDADLRIAGHSFSDGPWEYDILVTPENRPGRGDIFVRCGWNHGIQYYEGVPGAGPSGYLQSFGGFQQPMFRRLKRVIPFLNGRSLAYEWVDVASAPDGAIFAATELGCGVLSTAKKDWLWKLEGGMCLNACCTGRVDGRPVALTAGADGFVTAVDLADGRIIRCWHAGAPVVGVAQAPSGELIVATSVGVRSLDSAWQPRGFLARPVRRMLPLGSGRLLLCREDHTLELLETKKA